MSSKEPGGAAREGHTAKPHTNNLVKSATFLIVVLLCAGLFAFYSVKGAGKGANPGPHGSVAPTPTASLLVPTPTQALFYDTFLDNRNAWELSDHAGFTRELVQGRLVLTNTNPSTTLIESLPNEMMYDDFTLTITFAVQQGDANDSVGVYVRGDSNLDHDYRLEIGGNNTFDIAKEYTDKQSAPQEVLLYGPTSIPALHPPGQLNTMTVTLQGPTMHVMLNNMLVSTVTDGDYTSGQVALFVRHGATSARVTMSVSAIEIDRPG